MHRVGSLSRQALVEKPQEEPFSVTLTSRNRTISTRISSKFFKLEICPILKKWLDQEDDGAITFEPVATVEIKAVAFETKIPLSAEMKKDIWQKIKVLFD